MTMDALHLLKRDEAMGLIIDLQEKFVPVIDGIEEITRNAAILARALRELDIPLVVTEQYPKGLGPTIALIKEAVGDARVIEKRAFGCYGSEEFQQVMAPAANKTLILAGIETHVCVLQTALQARARGHRVFIVADAVGSRCPENKRMALDRLREADCILVTTEMALFELLGSSDAPEFKTIQAMIK